MATVGEAIAATLIAQWTAAGGAQPDPIQYLVERPERDPNPTVADAVYVWLPLRRKFDPVDVAGTYRNVTYTIRVVCHTKTSSARQKEIENEVDRILNSGTVITGATKQTVKEINDISNRTYSVLPKYISEVIVEVFTAMEVSATAYGTGTTSTFETDELTVNTHITGLGLTITDFLDEDNMISDSAVAFASQQSIKAYVDASAGGDSFKTITGITNDVVADAADDTLTLASADAKLTIVGTTATDTITFTVDETQISHDAIADVSTSDHHVLYTDAEAIAAVVAENPLLLTNDIQVGGSDVIVTGSGQIRSSATGGNVGIYSTNVWNDGATFACNDGVVGFRFFYDGGEIGSLDSTGDFQFDGSLTFGGASTITGPQLADLLMFGSANAAWVPCMYQMHSYTGGFVSDGSAIKGVGTNNSSMLWSLPLPTVKGTLKLYITGLQVGLQDADATDYIDRVIIYGADFDTATEILNDATDYTAPAEIEYALADTDCSSYKVIQIVIATVKATTGDIDIRNVALSCFYAT